MRPLQFIPVAQYGRYRHSVETRVAAAGPSPVVRRVVVVGTAGPSLVGTATVAVVRAALGIAAAARAAVVVEVMFPKSVPAVIEVVDSNPVVAVRVVPSLAAVDPADLSGAHAGSGRPNWRGAKGSGARPVPVRAHRRAGGGARPLQSFRHRAPVGRRARPQNDGAGSAAGAAALDPAGKLSG